MVHFGKFLLAPLAIATDLPASKDLYLPSGFDMMDGAKPSAVVPPSDCVDGTTAACRDSEPYVFEKMYTQTVKDKTEFSDMMHSVTKAEGGFMGKASISVGVNVAKESHFSESSISYFIGKSALTKRETVRNPVNLKLTPAAKELLQKDPMGFLKRHGMRYVYSITYGGSFMGFFTLYERSQSDKSDLDVFVGIKARILFFQVNASEDFQQKSSNAQSHLELQAGYAHSGARELKSNVSSPAELGKIFSDWERDLEKNPIPVTMTLRAWVDSEDVQEILNSHPKEIRDAFNVQPISEAVRDQLSDETGKVAVLKNSIKQSFQWPVTQTNATVRAQFTDLGHRADAHETDLEVVSEAKLVARQQELINGDFSWFVGGPLLDEFDATRNAVPPHIKALWSCEPGQGGLQTGTQIMQNDQNSAADCGDWCSAIASCVAFDYTESKESDSCRLYADKSARIGQPGDDNRMYCSATWVCEVGQGGEDFDKSDRRSFNDCGAHCARTKECVAFDFTPHPHTGWSDACRLFNTTAWSRPGDGGRDDRNWCVKTSPWVCEDGQGGTGTKYGEAFDSSDRRSFNDCGAHCATTKECVAFDFTPTGATASDACRLFNTTACRPGDGGSDDRIWCVPMSQKTSVPQVVI